MSPNFAAENTRTAVVVDADPAVCRLTVRALTEAHFACFAFTDGDAALAWLELNTAPQIITVDLPRVTGLMFAQRLRELPHLERVPLIVMCARHEPGDALLAGMLGAVFLAKQFRIRDFYEALHRLLNNAPARPRVMIVDDDACIREALEEVMRDEGYDAVCAKDGMEALKLLRESSTPPQVVILDVMMPKLDGIGVATELRATGAMSTLPVVLVSAHANIEDQAKKLGVAGSLRKPVELDELLAVIRDVTEHREVHR